MNVVIGFLLVALSASASNRATGEEQGLKPEFDSPYQNVTWRSNSSRFLTCEAEREKAMMYKWYNQDGDEITEDLLKPVYVSDYISHSRLIFKRISRENEGSYTCTARNGNGEASKVFFLRVLPPSGLKPEFDSSYQNLTLESGKLLYLACEAEGEKPITYKWYKQDGDEIIGDSKETFYVTDKELFSDLNFKSLSAEDEGSYTCTASNAHGQASKVFFLRVAPNLSGLKPEFDFPFQNVTLKSGSSRFLECRAEGDKPITYKWYNEEGDEITRNSKNPVHVTNGELSSDLTFKRLNIDHEGSYTCIARNTNGQASKVFFLRVQSPFGLKPVFDSPYQNVTRKSGRSEFLTCEAKGEKPITYKWYNQDGDEITGDSEKPVYVTKYELFSFLHFKRLSTEHEGSYTCTASNTHGQSSKVFFLRVPPPGGLKPEFDFPFQNVTLKSGSSQFLECRAGGEKPITYKWYNEDGDEITRNSKNPVHVTKGELSSDLTFNRLNREHEGSYSCTASNAKGKARKVFFLRVSTASGLKPLFDSPYQNVTRQPGLSEFLTCEAEGEKPITYKWYSQDGDEITGDRERAFYVTNYELFSFLHFKRLSTEHEGSYTCTASSANGQASKVFFLRVPPPGGLKPEFDFPFENVTLKSGSSQFLECQAEGEQPITYKWYNEDGDEITRNSKNTVHVTNGELSSDLTFNRLNKEHEGSYTCTANNAKGHSSKVFFLRVPPASGLKPLFDSPYQNVTRKSGTSDFLTCEAEGEKPITYKWYNQDGEEITGDREKPFYVAKYELFSLLHFKSLSTEHEGSYTCMVSNANGQASKVFFLRVLPSSGLKPLFDSPYQNVTRKSGTSEFLTCEAEGEKPITYKWYNQDGDEILGSRDKPFYVAKYELFSFLHFKSLSTEHEGSYTCMASNANGQTIKVFLLRVPPPSGLKPEFDFPYENVTLKSGSSQFLECQAEGEQPITYKWYNEGGVEITRNSKNLVHVTNAELSSHLTFNKLNREHEGPYTCTAINDKGHSSKVFFLRVPPASGLKPLFDSPYQNVTRKSGTSEFLTCEAEGEKPITYKWYNQDGDEITSDRDKPFYVAKYELFSFLHFKSLSTEHEGSYTCMVSNANGQASKVFFLRIPPSSELKPIFDFPYENVTLKSGSSRFLECQAEGEKPITYKWYNQDGDEITRNSKNPVHVTNGELSSGLTFNRLNRDQEGSYICTASNNKGHSSKVFFLRVPPESGLKPVFDSPYQNVTRKSDTSEFLTCEAEGEKPITYKWYYQDGDEITGDREKPFYVTNYELFSFLHFKRLRTEHEGSYTCMASNTHGQASKVFFLSVTPPSGLKPEFDFPYQDVSLKSGSSRFLECRAEGDQPITYKWYNEDGDEITRDRKKPVRVTNGELSCDLTFNRLSREHEGSYKCTASNAEGQASKVFFLRVLPPSGLKPEFDSPYQNVTWKSGSSRFLQCRAEGEKPITYKWYNEEGGEITSDRKNPVHVTNGELSSDLTFNRLSREHEGLYTCTASNAKGKANKVFFLRVPPARGLKPEFDSPYQDVSLKSGSSRFLECRAEGDQPITYKWYNEDGDEITRDRKKPVRVTNGELSCDLTFNRLSREHEGSYKCTASNAEGQASKVFFLRVLPPSDEYGLKPEFDSPYQNVTWKSGSSRFLECRAEGQKPITYKWYNEEGGEITSDRKKTVTNGELSSDLTFNRLGKEHEGSYTCTASNAKGQARKVFFLRVPPPSGLPIFDSPYQNVTLKSCKFLTCEAEGEKPITYKWYNEDGDEISRDSKNPVHVTNGELFSFLYFKRLSTEHEGSYLCTASNANGQTSKVFFLRAPPPSGLKPEFDFPFQNVTLESGRSQSLTCEAEGEKPIRYKWYKEGEEITRDSKNPFYLTIPELYSDLTFNPLSTEHEGSYTCTARNAHGQASMLFFLRTIPNSSGLKPEFDSPYQNVTWKSGSSRFLTCEAEGEKPITYKWYNEDAEEVTRDRKNPVHVTNGELSSDLTFNRLSPVHEGSYRCTASNAHGQANKVFFLRVPPPSGLKPGFDLPIVSITQEYGTWQYLRCEADEGEKPITYKWYNEDGDEVTGNSRKPVYNINMELYSNLYFKRLSTEHEGSYTCTASNTHGQASKMFFLRVLPPSDGNDADIDPNKGTARFRDAGVMKYTARSVMFYITTSGPVKYIEAKYRENKLASSETTIRLDPVPGNHSFEIGNLIPSGLYSFQFRTVPSESSKWSREYYITLLPDAPEIIWQSIGNRSVKLRWFTSTDDFLRGTIDKHQIKYFSVEMEGGNSWTSRNCSVTTEVPTCVGSSYTIWGLDTTIFYQIEVRAHTEAGYGEPWRQKVYLS